MLSLATHSDPNLEIGRMQWALHAAAQAAQGIDTRTFELAGRRRVRAELVPAVDQTMGEAVSVLDEVLARYDQPAALESPADSGVFNSIFEELIATPCATDARQRIADVSFMARWELARKRDAVTVAAGRDDDWQLISECCSARRRVVKAASGVERVLCEVEERPSMFASLYRTETQLAIGTRAVYYSFCWGLRAIEQIHCHEAVDRTLRLAGVGIARLVGRSIYEDLRVEDRRSLRALQSRLIAWLRGPQHRQEGQRILSDVSAFASLMMEVNHRPELIEHDHLVLEKLLAALLQPAADPQAFHAVLQTIRGRDIELDGLINAQTELRPARWRDPVERVLAQLQSQPRPGTATTPTYSTPFES